MASAPRNSKNKGLPVGLYQDKKGFIFRRIDGKQVRLGLNRARAVQIANHYNSIYRVERDLLSKVMAHQFVTFRQFLKAFENEIIPERELSDSWLTELKRKLKILNAELGAYDPRDLDLEIITKFLESVASSPRMFNQWRSLLVDIFKEMMDKGIVETNFAENKKPKKEKKSRKRLTPQQFVAIREASPSWLQIAMDLAFQTTHSRNEVVNAKYSDIVGEFLRIARKKTKKHAASFVEIPMSSVLKEIIKRSRDNVISPFIVHAQPIKITQARRKYEHWTYVTPEQLTRAFKEVRDELEIFENVPMNERPTFHEIRALSIWVGEKAGYDMQARAAHSDREMTEKYKSGHEIEWNRVENIELKLPKI